MHNKKLSISIPTYNRHEILYENLQLILPELVQHSIAIYISDDSNDDNTIDIVNELKKLHPYIYYVKNSPSLGHDKNIWSALQLPSTDYVWLLGDSVIIKNGSISKLLSVLNTDYDFIFINSYVNNAGKIEEVRDIRDFLKDFAWYLTLTGATIYNSKTIRDFNAKGHVKYYRNFQQLAIIFDYVSVENISSYWVNEKLISINTKKKSYWTNNVIDVFVIDWSSIIKSFPCVFANEAIMNEVIFSHARNTNFFSLKKLLLYRSDGAINFNNNIKNYKYIKIAARNSTYLFFIVSILPKILLRFTRKILIGY